MTLIAKTIQFFLCYVYCETITFVIYEATIYFDDTLKI